MVHRVYLNRLAFGQSVYEPWDDAMDVPGLERVDDNLLRHTDSYGYTQHYDRAGRPVNPRTREMNRRLRIAQNRVMEIANVVEKVDKNDTRSDVQDRRMRFDPDDGENPPSSSSINSAEVSAVLEILLAQLLAGLKQRSLSFPAYLKLSTFNALQGHYVNLGALAFLARGLPAGMGFEISIQNQKLFEDDRLEGYVRRYQAKASESKKESLLTRCSPITFKRIFRSSTFVLIAPLEILAIQQRLGLVPAWPGFRIFQAMRLGLSFPLIKIYVPWHSLSSSLIFELAKAFALWPPLLLWALTYGKWYIGGEIFKFIGIPCPTSTLRQTPRLKDAFKDLHSLKTYFLYKTQPWRAYLGSWESNRAYKSLKARVEQDEEASPLDADQGAVSTAGTENLHPAQPQRASQGANDHERDSITDQRVSDHVPHSDLGAEPGSPPTTASTHSESTMQTGIDSASEGSFNEWERVDVESSAEESNWVSTSILDTHLCDFLFYAAQAFIPDLLFLPLEALLVRSVARNFLRGTSPSGRTNIYPLNSWLGGPGNRANYASKLLLYGALKFSTSYVVWNGVWVGAWWWRKEYWRWGLP